MANEKRFVLWVRWHLPEGGLNEKLEGVFLTAEDAHSAGNTFRGTPNYWCYFVHQVDTEAVNPTWSRERPTAPGWYWFYGFVDFYPLRDLELRPVEVTGKLRLTFDVGRETFEVTKTQGWWFPLTPPKPPGQEDE